MAALEAREEALQSEARRLDELRRRLDAERQELAFQREKLQEMAMRLKQDAALLAARTRAIQGMLCPVTRVLCGLLVWAVWVCGVVCAAVCVCVWGGGVVVLQPLRPHSLSGGAQA